MPGMAGPPGRDAEKRAGAARSAHRDQVAPRPATRPEAAPRVSTLRPVPDANIEVLLACGHALLRAGYRAVLEAGRNLTVVGEAETGLEAVKLARELHPDAVLMDIEIPDGD